ncbi:hypothetical protein D3C72_1178830 [compost metagenome]
MVTQTLGNFVRVIGFVRFQTEDLRGTGFRRDFVRGPGEVFVCGPVRTVGHAVHAVFGYFPEAGMNIAHRRFMWL